jgi:hypothetical protein
MKAPVFCALQQAWPVMYSKPLTRHTFGLFQSFVNRFREIPNMNMDAIAVYKRTIKNGRQTEDLKCCIDEIAYQRIIEYAQVTELSFWLLGHGTMISSLPNFTSYDNVHTVHFASHFSYITPAFKIISQLRHLKNVKFTIDSNQKFLFLEYLDQDYQQQTFSGTPNHNVTTLEVNANPTGCTCLILMDMILEVVLKNAELLLTNLRTLKFDFPITVANLDVILHVILNGRKNRLVEQHIDLNVQVSPPVVL